MSTKNFAGKKVITVDDLKNRKIHQPPEDDGIPKLHIVKSSVKDRIKNDRNEFGWTQSQLDQLASVPKNTVQSYESGKAVIDPINQQRILKVLDKERTRREKEKNSK